MADAHFLIEKKAEDGKTHTGVRRLDEDEIIDELARILGGVEITEAVKKAALEMKKMADEVKSGFEGGEE